ncbi:MAG: LmeA family phospholipid-binding protein [Pseudonocardiaceae bacterium]
MERGNGVRKLVIVVLVVLGLAVAADFGAAAVAEYTLARKLKEQLTLPSDPSVRINGVPFLTQALAGRYTAIDIRATGLPVEPLRDVAVETTLHDVDAPLPEVISGSLQSVRAAWVDGRVRIKDSDLGRAIGIEDLRIQRPSDEEIKEVLPEGTASNGNSTSDNQAAIRMVATTDLLGQRTEIIGVGLIELTDDLVRITVSDVRLARDDIGTVNLPREIRRLLLKTLSTDVKPGGLPFHVTPTGVSVQPGSLLVEGTANNVSMGRAGIGAG